MEELYKQWEERQWENQDELGDDYYHIERDQEELDRSGSYLQEQEQEKEQEQEELNRSGSYLEEQEQKECSEVFDKPPP